MQTLVRATCSASSGACEGLSAGLRVGLQCAQYDLDEVAMCGSSDAFLGHLQEQSMGNEGIKVGQRGWRELLETRQAHQALYREHKIEAAKPLRTVYEGLPPLIGVININLTATRRVDGSVGDPSTPERRRPGFKSQENLVPWPLVETRRKTSVKVRQLRTNCRRTDKKKERPAPEALPTRSAMQPRSK